MNPTNVISVKGANTNIHTVWFHLHSIQKQAKGINGERSQDNGAVTFKEERAAVTETEANREKSRTGQWRKTSSWWYCWNLWIQHIWIHLAPALNFSVAWNFSFSWVSVICTRALTNKSDWKLPPNKTKTWKDCFPPFIIQKTQWITKH